MGVRFYFLATVLSFFVLSIPAERVAAQEGGDDFENQIIGDVIGAVEDTYVEPTIPNLSKLYWALGKLDIDNDALIDFYLMINECELYKQYYNNDIEWGRIQEAARQDILKSLATFPTRFEIMTPISLGRYDLTDKKFELVDKQRVNGMRRLDFAGNDQAHKVTCTKTGEIYDYPANLIIILNRPLVIDDIPVEYELAQLYIDESKSAYEALPPDLQVRLYERRAYLRLKVRITQYKNTVRVVNGDLRAVVFGTLDGYEIYADAGKMKPLYTKTITEKRFMRLKKPDSSPEQPKEESLEDEAVSGGSDETPEEGLHAPKVH